MDIGPVGSYRLPPLIQDAYGAETAQELADKLGVTKRPSPNISSEADAAYRALQEGNPGPARTLLVDRLGVSEQDADDAIAKLPDLT